MLSNGLNVNSTHGKKESSWIYGSNWIELFPHPILKLKIVSNIPKIATKQNPNKFAYAKAN